MPTLSPQLLVIVGGMDRDYRSAILELRQLIIDELRVGDDGVEILQLLPESPGDPEYDLRFVGRWSHLLIATHLESIQWRNLVSILPRPLSSIFILGDWIPESTPEYFFREYRFQGIPLHYISFDAPAPFEGRLRPPSLQAIRRAAYEISRLIRDNPVPMHASTEKLSSSPTNPELNSLATLLALRDEVEIERRYIPEAKIARDVHPSFDDSYVAPNSVSNHEVLARAESPSDNMAVPHDAAPPSRATDVIKWLLLGTSTTILGLFLYRREIGALIAPLIKLFGSMVLPPAASVDLSGAEFGDADDVELAAFAPSTCGPGQTILVQALLHLPADQPSAYTLAAAADPSAVRKAIQTLAIALRRGEKLQIDLEAEGCRIDEVSQRTVWRGKPIVVQFFAEVPREREMPIPIRIIVTRSGIPVGSVRFTVPVKANSKAQPIELRGEIAKRFERAFVSYAREDRVVVLGYAQALNLAGIEIFQDLLSLEPGDHWERRLYSEIERSDLFVLFWSRAASRSKWVIAEAEYALHFSNQSDGRTPVIRPFLLEGPPIPTIPASLEAINFNDKFRYMILGARAAADAHRDAPPAN